MSPPVRPPAQPPYLVCERVRVYLGHARNIPASRQAAGGKRTARCQHVLQGGIALCGTKALDVVHLRQLRCGKGKAAALGG